MTKGKKILAHAVLILASFLSVFPLYYMLCGATNTSIDVVRGKLIPGTYLVENFKSLVANPESGAGNGKLLPQRHPDDTHHAAGLLHRGLRLEIYHDRRRTR